MARKIISSIFIALACVVLFFVVCIMILFLAPGTEILGVRYIAHSISEFSETYHLTSDELRGDIYIDTYGVPMTIEYRPMFADASTVYFRQDFIGLTKSKVKKANLDVHLDEQRNLHISTVEIVPWLYSFKSAAGDNFEFKLTLPVGMQGKSLYINSDRSKVSIIGDPVYQNLEVKTSEGMLLDGTVYATNLKYHTSKQIVVGGDLTCENADLRSTNNDISITQPLPGDLRAQTDGGNIKFISVNTLWAKTGSGDILHYGEGMSSVAGRVEVSTRSGNIELGNVGSAQTDEAAYCKITTSSGDVKMTSCIDGNISNSRGKVRIDELRNLILGTSTGDVWVGAIHNAAVINSKSGKVNLGEIGEVSNPDVRTTTGTINVKNAKGYVSLYSSSNSVTLNNESSKDIILHAGKSLKAYNLGGEVEAYANGDVDMVFGSGTTGLDLNTGSHTNDIKIDLTCMGVRTVNYDLKSSRGKKACLYAGAELLEEKSVIRSSEIVDGFPMVKVRTAYGRIVLKLGA